MSVNNHRDTPDQKCRPNPNPRETFAFDLALSGLWEKRVGQDDSNVLEGLKQLPLDREFADPKDPHGKERGDSDFETDLQTHDSTDGCEELDVSASPRSQFLAGCRNSSLK